MKQKITIAFMSIIKLERCFNLDLSLFSVRAYFLDYLVDLRHIDILPFSFNVDIMSIS